MKVVKNVRQIKVKASGRGSRKQGPLTSKIIRAKNLPNLGGVEGGTGLGDYSLDVMVLDSEKLEDDFPFYLNKSKINLNRIS